MQGDVPLEKAMIVWSSMKLNPPIKVVPVGWLEDVRYCFTWGACSYDFIYATPEQKLLQLFVMFNELVLYHKIKPMAVHQAFVAIPEYRASILSNLNPEVISDIEAKRANPPHPVIQA